MRKKTVILISFFAVLLVAAVILVFALTKGRVLNSKTDAGKAGSNMGSNSTVGKLVYKADDLDSLISDSPYIVVAQVTGDQSGQNFQNVNFETTKLNVQSVLKGDIKDGERISLLQTVSDLDPTVAKGSTVLLFWKNMMVRCRGLRLHLSAKGDIRETILFQTAKSRLPKTATES